MELKGSDDCGVSPTCYNLTKYFTTAMVVAVPFTCNVVVVTHMALIVLAALMLALYPLQTKVIAPPS